MPARWAQASWCGRCDSSLAVDPNDYLPRWLSSQSDQVYCLQKGRLGKFGNLRSARTGARYLGRVKAQRIGAKTGRGFAVSAVVDRMRGTGMSGSPVGLVLPIYMEGDAPDLSDAASMDAMRHPLASARIGPRVAPSSVLKGKIYSVV